MRAYPSTVKEIRFSSPRCRSGFRFWSFFILPGQRAVLDHGALRRPGRRATISGLGPSRSRGAGGQYQQCAAGGLEYSDCYLYDNDARFVFNFIRKSLNYGCIAANYVESLGARTVRG